MHLRSEKMKRKKEKHIGKKFIAKFLILCLFVLPFGGTSFSFAANMGDDITVNDIRFVREHDGFNTVGAYIEISGTGLKGKTIRFEKAGLGGGYETIGKQVVDEETFIKFTFTPKDAEDLSGRLRIGTTEVDLGLKTFPNLSGIDKQNVNLSRYGQTPAHADAKLVITGNNLSGIGKTTPTGKITAEYGRVQAKPIDSTQSYVSFAPDFSTVTLTEPPLPGEKGFQNIVIEKKENPGGYKTSVRYLYAKGFRFMEDLGLSNPVMFPNTGAKGDFVYFTAPNFLDTKNYDAYFLKTLDGSDGFTEKNKGKFVALELGKLPSDNDRLIVKVPEGKDFELRSYYVVLTHTVNGEIIAQQILKRSSGDYDQFTVIGSGFQPTVESIFPKKGPDTGANVQISGRNLLSLNLPDLDGKGDFKAAVSPAQNPSGKNGDKILVIEYDDSDLTYRGKPVTVKREMKVQIGKQATFVKGTDGQFTVNKGLPDNILVKTDTIDDAAGAPLKDVVIEMETIIEEKGTGNKYVFNQIVTKEKGYEFEPSTLTPIVDSVTPDTIQIEDYTLNTPSGNKAFNRFSEDTLIAIKGKKFLVDKEVDASGNAFVRYPTVLIKKNNDNTFINKYQIGFFPNEQSQGVRGIIKYKIDENQAEEFVLKGENGKPIPLEILVVDENNKIVDGTEKKDIGVKILIKVPRSALLKDGGIKHVQVTNPRRQSDILGASAIKSDILSFVKTSDVPVIESVNPQIATVEGKIKAVITGANFQDGVRLFLDGEAIEKFSRDIAPDGEKILLTFDVPPGRRGTTQLQVINPDGGLAVKDFTYVTSFAKDPEIEDFNPKKGTKNTLVVIDGDNYLRPDPTAAGTGGYEGLRLIGTRVFVDGKDINRYYYDSLGNIRFSPYTSPEEEVAIKVEAGKAMYSTFYKNVSVYRKKAGSSTGESEEKIFYLGFDAKKNPRITNGKNHWYDIRRNKADSGYEAYDKSGKHLGEAKISYDGNGKTQVSIPDGAVFSLTMNNHILNTKPDPSGVERADVADYAQSVILKRTDGTDEVYYTLTKNFKDEVRLSNGRDDGYTVRWDTKNNKFIASKDTGGKETITLSEDKKTLKIGASKTLSFLTPYVTDASTKAIVGDRTEVISKNQILIRIPEQETGKGFKDIRVVNPDTKYAQKVSENGFYYVTQPSARPVITRIDPSKGAVEGGYVTDIFGYDFREGIEVFIDGQKIPSGDLTLGLDGKKITVKVPKYKRDLAKTYGVDGINVSVVILNQDGSSDSVSDGFRYIIPVGSPVIKKISPTEGSSTGGDVVEIVGHEFRFFEPYKNKVGGEGYDKGDPFEDLEPNGKWDNLLDVNKETDKDGDGIVDIIKKIPNNETAYFQYYLESPILPKVYFGRNQAKILEFANGYMKVLTPKHESGTVDVTVANNDLGISNAVKYTYSSSGPKIGSISPNKGRKQGVETKDIYGSQFYRSKIKGYQNDKDDSIETLNHVQALVRFGNIDNKKIDREAPNSGLIYNQRTTVKLGGALEVVYDGSANTVRMSVEENGKVYTRVFNNYNDEDVYFPLEMLKSKEIYYTPSGYKEGDGKTYSKKIFEYIRIRIENRRLIVERGYAPRVTYDSVNHLVVTSPAYHTIDPVTVTVTNPDGGRATVDFTYTNPDSDPKIYSVGPRVISADNTYWMVEGAVNGNIEIEILGTDLRKNAKVRVGSKEAAVKERTTKTIGEKTYDVLIVQVSKGTEDDVDKKYPVVVENEDKGLANSATLDNLIGPNYGNATLPFYFIYRKPLSGPTISSVKPTKTSVFGGHEVVVRGKDFRKGAIIIIGTVGGIPIKNVSIEEDGTLIRFKTPKNMIVGKKAVVVQNSDFGQAILEEGIQIVSYPKVEDIQSEDGGSTGGLSVEGGRTIIIKGEGFQEDAKVVFDGQRSLYKDESQKGEMGLWKDDKTYVVENGVLAQKVEFVDTKTLKVTTPPLNKEDYLSVTVINKDSGISDGDIQVRYTQPVPSKPIGLKVEMVAERYIKLHGYSAKDVEYYEVFYNISSGRLLDLKRDNYTAFSYLATTDSEPYKISKLPGFERAEKGDRIHFVIRAVNKFGPSSYSQIALLTYKDFKDVEGIGPEDTDGGLGVPEGQTHRVQIHGGAPLVELGEKDIPAKVSVDLRFEKFDIWAPRAVHLPGTLIQKGRSLIFIDYGDVQIQFSPLSLNTEEFRRLQFEKNTYGNLLTQWVKGAYAQSLLNDVPRGKKAVGSVWKIEFSAQNNEKRADFQKPNSPVDIALSYGELGNEGEKIEIYKYTKGVWKPHAFRRDESGKRISLRADEAGYFLMMKDR